MPSDARRWLLLGLLIWSGYATETVGARYNGKSMPNRQSAYNWRMLSGDNPKYIPPKKNPYMGKDRGDGPTYQIDSFNGRRPLPESELNKKIKRMKKDAKEKGLPVPIYPRTEEEKDAGPVSPPSPPLEPVQLPTMEKWTDKNGVEHWQIVGAPSYRAPPNSTHSRPGENVFTYDSDGVPVVPDVTPAEKKDVASWGGARQRSYSNGAILQNKYNSNYRASERMEVHRKEVEKRSKNLLAKLRSREGVITQQTREQQDLRQNFTAERTEAPAKDRKQLRWEYTTVKEELEGEQSAYLNKMKEEAPQAPDVPTLPPVPTDCDRLHVALTHAVQEVRLPNLIPGCSRFKKAYEEHIGKQQYTAAQKRRLRKERKALDELNPQHPTNGTQPEPYDWRKVLADQDKEKEELGSHIRSDMLDSEELRKRNEELQKSKHGEELQKHGER